MAYADIRRTFRCDSAGLGVVYRMNLEKVRWVLSWVEFEVDGGLSLGRMEMNGGGVSM